MDVLEITSTHSSEFDGSSTIDGDKECRSPNTERVRVDRHKLEEMLQETQPGQPTAAEGFFRKIMNETDTQIFWPTKLKVGAKSKKDPHVKVCGPPQAISKARDSILEILDTKRHRVTMKMDVSYTDHSYVIGKGGRVIQQVMDQTGCHIHFPDSNRNSQAEKSNQVSIAGQPCGVENARAQIRELLPVIVSFEVPLSIFVHLAVDPSSSVLQEVQRIYGITVAFRQFHPNLARVIVKGCRRHADRLRQGLCLLTEYLLGSSTMPLLVTLTTEIAPQHHGFVMGRGSCNVHYISQLTGCTITFPDLTAPSAPAQMTGPGTGLPPGAQEMTRRSTVVIAGHFDGVFAAWLEILGHLPLALMFDLKEGRDIDMLVIAKLMEHLSVNITVKPKPKRNSKCIVVRGQESDSRKLFEVRRILLDLDTDELEAVSSDSMPLSVASALLHSLGINLQDPLLKELIERQSGRNSHVLPGPLPPATQLPSGGPFLPACFPPHQQAMLLPLLLNQMTGYSKVPTAPCRPWGSSLGSSGPSSPPFSNWRDLKRVQTPSENDSHSSGVSCTSPSSRESPVDGYPSTSCGTVEELCRLAEQNGNPYGHCWEEHRVDRWRQESMAKNVCKTNGRQSDTDTAGWSTSPKQAAPKNFGSVGWEKKVTFNSPPSYVDYENRRLLATKAMQEPVGSTKRVPTSAWAGLGFSKSMPESMVKEEIRACGFSTAAHRPKIEDAKMYTSIDQSPQSGIWTRALPDDCLGATGTSASREPGTKQGHMRTHESPFSFSNFFEGLDTQPLLEGSYRDLPHLLTHLGLGKYINVFHQNEVDLQTFLMMTDADFQKLCIPYGAKMKMLLAISDLNQRMTGLPRQFQAAPGAERHHHHH